MHNSLLSCIVHAGDAEDGWRGNSQFRSVVCSRHETRIRRRPCSRNILLGIQEKATRFDAIGIGGAFAFGHFLSAIFFGTIGALLGLGVDVLIPQMFDRAAGILAGVLVIILGFWIVRGCASGKCYERRSHYRMISFQLPDVQAPQGLMFSLPVIGAIGTVFYKSVYKILYACSICLSNWVGFLFSISPPIEALAAFLLSAATGNILYGIFLAMVYGGGILLTMSLIGATEGAIFESLYKNHIRVHNRVIGVIGSVVLAFGVWFLFAQLIPGFPAPWEHY